MNHCVPDWGMEDDIRSFHELFPASSERKSAPAPDNELVELLWRNGHVVMQSQTSRKPAQGVCEPKQAHKPDPQLNPLVPLVTPSNLIQEDDTSSWFQYALDDSLEKEFCSEFLSEMPAADAVDADKPNKAAMGDGSMFTMPPPKHHIGATNLDSGLTSDERANFSHFSMPMRSGSGVVVGMGECSSIRTVGSSACGSNQVHGKGLKEGGSMISPRDGVRASAFDATVTSSSGGSGCSLGRTTGQQSTSYQTNKRKGMDLDQASECHSEDADYESMDANRPTQPPAIRKSRAAEVHNLSERRRRDRINEKMKALQELIPHCNKSDKASMLDEAIEYLKSLQLQLQLMWMGSGMAPMIFPGAQQYMSRVHMPSINSLMPLSNSQMANHSASQTTVCPSPSVSPINFPAQMQNQHIPDPYARYFGYPHMQLHPQAVNLYAYGSHTAQQNLTAAGAGSSCLPTACMPSENIQNGHSG